MNFDFYLFNVDHGQSAAARLPNGRWCIFDVGRSATFSPVQFIINNYINRRSKEPTWTRRPPYALAKLTPFSFLKSTISHLHADHLDDYLSLFAVYPGLIKTVNFDEEYLSDVIKSTSEESFSKVIDFCSCYNKFKKASANAEPVEISYGNVRIIDKSIPLPITRRIDDNANSRVNNASIITRIDCYRNSILICGDMEEKAWEFVLNNPAYRSLWERHVSNIDILVAPHHGHTYSNSLMSLASPSIVLISIVSKDESIDSRYNKRITTRDRGHIHLSIARPPVLPLKEKGKRTWDYWK